MATGGWSVDEPTLSPEGEGERERGGGGEGEGERERGREGEREGERETFGHRIFSTGL